MSYTGTSSGGSIYSASDVALSNPANGQVLTYNGTTQKWANITPATGSSGSPVTFGAFRPEDYGAKADGSTDDSAAINAAITAAAAVAINGVEWGVVQFQSSKTYRIANPIIMQGGVDLNLNSAMLAGPITGYAQISSSNAPSAPSGTNMVAQIAGAAITDAAYNGNSAHFGDVLYHVRIRNGTITGFRFGIVTACFAWSYPIFEHLTFYDCNIGIWTYQGAQEPRLINCRSTGDMPGTTFVGSATAFPSGHTLRNGANTDNYFTDGFVYDGAGDSDRETSTQNSAFDTWFQNGVLQPGASSIGAANPNGYVFPYASGSDTCMVSGRVIYIPQRNDRITFTPNVRRLDAQACARGAVLVANPYQADIANISGEGMFQNAAGAMVVVPVHNGVNPTGVFRNIDAQYTTYTSTYAVEVRNGSSGGVASTGNFLVGLSLGPGGSGKVNATGQWTLLG